MALQREGRRKAMRSRSGCGCTATCTGEALAGMGFLDAAAGQPSSALAASCEMLFLLAGLIVHPGDAFWALLLWPAGCGAMIAWLKRSCRAD